MKNIISWQPLSVKNWQRTVVVDEFGIFHIVDGQQRLTTLIIYTKGFT